MYNDITGVILSGGKSSRMGINKSFLKLGDMTIIEHIIKLMKSNFGELLLITNSPSEYSSFQLPMYEDIYKWNIPLAGIHSGLYYSRTESIFVISCDVPLMTTEMIQYIVDYKSEKPIKFCVAAGYHQPLVGVYNKGLIPEIEKFFSINSVNDKSFHQFLKNVAAEIIIPEDLSFYRDEIFFNVNKPKDYESILEKYEEAIVKLKQSDNELTII